MLQFRKKCFIYRNIRFNNNGIVKLIVESKTEFLRLIEDRLREVRGRDIEDKRRMRDSSSF